MEIEEGSAKLVPHEKFMAELGVSDERSAEELGKDHKEYERISARNEKVYGRLLGK